MELDCENGIGQTETKQNGIGQTETQQKSEYFDL